MNREDVTSGGEVSFRQWAVVEVMGHRRFAGFVTVETIAGPMVRVDVPAVEGRLGFTKMLSPQSIYAITPTTEAIARRAAKQAGSANRYRRSPVDAHRIEFDDDDVPY
ncbi:MAG: hypothetical protein ACPGWS_00570 [Solirubrobacterales bacterium]